MKIPIDIIVRICPKTLTTKIDWYNCARCEYYRGIRRLSVSPSIICTYGEEEMKR